MGSILLLISAGLELRSSPIAELALPPSEDGALQLQGHEGSRSGGGGTAHGSQGGRGCRSAGAGGLDDLGDAGCGTHEFRLHAPLSLT